MSAPFVAREWPLVVHCAPSRMRHVQKPRRATRLRAWISLKSAITSGDNHAILAECERGEDSAIEQYEKAMNDNPPAPLHEIVSRQYSQIKNAHDRIKNLRDTAKMA